MIFKYLADRLINSYILKKILSFLSNFIFPIFPIFYDKCSWQKMKALDTLSLNIEEKTLVSVDTPSNYIGEIEFDVTPWMTPILKDRFMNEKRVADKKVKINKVSKKMPNVFGLKRRLKLMVCIYMIHLLGKSFILLLLF